ncbi:MAG: hypothetical protein IK043_00360 [Candidatus Methanomethylophilaceae archaeon]|nr:hypothetical protein [Candidatus Methanomethylophilaceae archaeon]
MQSRTQSLTVAAIVAALAGAITIGFMAAEFTGIDSSNTLGTCCMYLIVAVLFFALAGGFKDNGQWNVSMMEFMCFVIIAIVVFAAILEIFSIAMAVILIAMAVFVLICVLLSLRSENWFGA